MMDREAFSDLDEEFNDLLLEKQALERYSESESYQAFLVSRYRNYHHYYAPYLGDQWPEDAAERPGLIHVTHNIIRPFVDTEARIESKIPRATLQADSQDPDERKRAEMAEKLMLRFLEMSDWAVWLQTLNQGRGIYGKGIIKVFWDDSDPSSPPRPNATVVENPANLRIGWGASDFSTIDWALYEYSLSPFEVMRRWKDAHVVPTKGEAPLLVQIQKSAGDHADPIENVYPTPMPRFPRYSPSEYEEKQVTIWDYWTKDLDGSIIECVFAQGKLVEKTEHPEMIDIPYIPVELDHEPGSPEGIGIVQDLVDVQIEMNRAISHFAQLVNDEVDPAWQINADALPGGMVPSGGEILAVGEDKEIKPIPKGVNQFPIQQLVQELYKAAHFGTGLPEIMFSLPPGAQTAGRALQIQIEASANRIEPRRNRLYSALRQLLIFWTVMLERKNPKVGDARVGDLVRGLRRWTFVAPEITPRDVIEATTNVVNKVQAKLISLEDGMDELGVESPIEMKQKIEQERTNPKLFPGDTQAFVAVLNLLIQLPMLAAQAGIDLGSMMGGLGAAQQAQGQQQLEAQNAAPVGLQGDNQSGAPQPMTVAGGPPPPVGQNQTLIRNNPTTGGATALQQIAIRPGA